jgi:hypothetical protein
MEVHVQCYSGHKADERPVRLFLGEREVEVQAILDRWCGEDHDYFKLAGDDGHIYIVRRDRRRDAWELTHCARGDAPAPGPGRAGT